MYAYTALTIAGSDPGGGAGIQADLKVFKNFGVYGISALTAATAQNTLRVNAIQRIEAPFIKEQLNTLLTDIRPDALKTGMLLSVDAVRAVASAMMSFGLRNLVTDPIIISTSGAYLLEKKAAEVMKEELFPLTRVITPNISEASTLTGIAVSDEASMEAAAIELKKFGSEAVIVTGGHLDDYTLDLMFDGESFTRFRGKKSLGEFHGTGCAYSAAITALLAKGYSVTDAAREAGEYVKRAIEGAITIGKGMRLLGL